MTESPRSYIESFLDELQMPGANKTTFFMMGYCLFHLQALEASLKAALKMPFALANLESEDRENRQKTLGVLLRKLRERVAIDDDLQDLLVAVLESRNFFVHHLTHDRDVTKESDLVEISNACQVLSIQAREVTKFLNAAILKANPDLSFVGVDAEEATELVPIIDGFLRRR